MVSVGSHNPAGASWPPFVGRTARTGAKAWCSAATLRVRIRCPPPSKSGIGHPALSVFIGILPRFVGRALRHPAYAISLLSTPGRRSGALVRSPFLVPRHCAFPTLGRYDPATRDVANFQPRQRHSVILTFEPLERSTVIARFVSRSAGRHPCHRAGSLAGHPGPPAFGQCALSCAWPASSRRLRRHPGRRWFERVPLERLSVARKPPLVRYPPKAAGN